MPSSPVQDLWPGAYSLTFTALADTAKVPNHEQVYNVVRWPSHMHGGEFRCVTSGTRLVWLTRKNTGRTMPHIA